MIKHHTHTRGFTQHQRPFGAGFTLIEIIVSVAIFSIVMVIALGALLSISAGERKAETLKAVMNNLNFALESMSRTLRTGSAYECGQGVAIPCPNGAAEIRAKNTSLYPDVAYKFENSNATRCDQPSGVVGCLVRSTDPTDPDDYIALTAPEVIIKNVTFYLIGNGSSDGMQPKIIITLSGYVQLSGSQQTPFNIQTSITQRIYDST